MRLSTSIVGSLSDSADGEVVLTLYRLHDARRYVSLSIDADEPNMLVGLFSDRKNGPAEAHELRSVSEVATFLVEARAFLRGAVIL